MEPRTRNRLFVCVSIILALGVLGVVSFFASPALFGNDAGHWLVASVVEHPTSTPALPLIPKTDYFEVMDGCNSAYVGECATVRAGPSVEYKAVARLRIGVVLRIQETVTVEGRAWHKIEFVHPLLYPERAGGSWYVAADLVREFKDDGDILLEKDSATTTKRIVIDVSKQLLTAYDGDVIFMQEEVSTGLDFTPTPHGTFTVFKKTPSRFMQGPIPGVSAQVYDLPGVPWNLYFTSGGAVIHGAYWHEHFGNPWSHGCVNLPPQKARALYEWALVGTTITVQN